MTAARKRNKPYNFRLIAALALSMVVGILSGAAAVYFAVDGLYLLVPFSVAATALIACILKFKDASLAVSLALVIAAFMLGALSVYIYCSAFASAEVPTGVSLLIEGKVDKVGKTSGGSTYLVISGARANGETVGGKIIAYLGASAGDYCEKGYTVRFYAPLSKQSLFEGGEITYYAQNSIKYYCTVNGGLSSKWGFSLFGAANGGIRNTLFDNLDKETASVCYAMLTGDSSLISEGTLSSFRGGGIAHLFAVSGLHIGIIFGALTLLFKRLPINVYVSAAIRVVAIILYSGVCNFTPSSVRATIMCTAVLCASLLHKKNDSLNSLSLAALVLLVINPMYLFGAGFLLSFGAALGIIMLGRNTETVLRFLPERVRKPLAVGFSAQVSTIPTQFACFGYISWAGLFLNVLVVPIVSLIYLLLFICTLLAAIIPFASGALVGFASTPVQLLVNLVVECGLENAVITRSAGLWISAPFVLLVVGISDKFNLKQVWRSTLCSLALVALTLGFLIT